MARRGAPTLGFQRKMNPFGVKTGEMFAGETLDKVVENRTEAGIGAGGEVKQRWGVVPEEVSCVFSRSKASGKGLVTKSAAPMT